MDVVICSNGHIFDRDISSVCPQCGVKSKVFSSALNKPDVRQIVINEKNAVPDLQESRTVSYYSSSGQQNDFVTGWLVTLNGTQAGRDHRLHHGFNRIGRDIDMDISVDDDMTISRKNHCSIAYDDKSIKFYLCPGMGTTTYINQKLLEDCIVLNEHDIIKIGNTLFEFIPFCREGRVWENT